MFQSQASGSAGLEFLASKLLTGKILSQRLFANGSDQRAYADPLIGWQI